MSTSTNTFSFFLKSKLGLIPGALKIERDDKAIREEYGRLLDYEAGGEPAKYLELKSYVSSQDFKDRKREIENQRFQDTEAWAKEQEYRSLKKTPEFKNYLRFINSPHYENFKKYEASEDLNKHEKLRDYVTSFEFNEQLKHKFANTDDYKKYLDYKKLKSTKEIIHYYRIRHSRDYHAVEKLHASKELKAFEELENMVNSVEFKTMRRVMKSQEFKETPEYEKFQKYQSLLSDPSIKAYLRQKKSRAFPDFLLLKDSPEIKEFESLEKFVTSGDLEKARKEFEAKLAAEKFKLSQFKAEKKSGKFKGYYVLSNSNMFDDYRQIHDSRELKHFRELEKYLESKEYKEIKQYMKSSGKFKKSGEYQKLLQFRELDRSPKIRWYFKQIDHKKFDEVRNYELSFFEDFQGTSPDKKKWITSYFWGKKLLKEGYSLAGDLHLLTDGDNISLENGTARILTKKEKVHGKAWNPAIGFHPADFEYTSGILSSGESFRQQYGIFEAKVRLGAHPSVFHTFWMLGNHMLPHVDVFRFLGKSRTSIHTGSFHQDRENIRSHKSSVSGPDFSKSFNIIRLEWTPEKMVWKVNNQTVHTQSSHLPQEEMYFSFSSGVHSATEGHFPAVSMDIDWVRCQKMKTNGKEE